MEWTDGDGVTNTSTTSTPFTIDDTNFVNLTTNQTIDGQKVFSMNIETTGVQITGGINENILLDGGSTIPITDLQLNGYQEEGGIPSDGTFQVTIGDPNEDNTGFNLRVSPGDSEFIVGDIYGNESGTLFKLNDADGRIQLGDPNNLNFSLVLDIDGQTRRVLLGANGNNSNDTSITINDANGTESIILSANNGVFINDDLNIGNFGNRATISTNSTSPNVNLELPSETGRIALTSDIQNLETVTSFTNDANSNATYTSEDGTSTTISFLDRSTNQFALGVKGFRDGVAIGQNSTTLPFEIRQNAFGIISQYRAFDGIVNPLFQVQLTNEGTVLRSASTTGGNDIIFQTGAFEGMRLSTLIGGSEIGLGVGIAAPMEKLDVDGNVLANSFLTTSDIRHKYNFVDTGIVLSLIHI